MSNTIGDNPELRREILAAGQAALDAQTAPTNCQHLGVLRGEGRMELPPTMAAKYPLGIYLGTCVNGCGTTKSARVFDEAKEWPQFGQVE
ncbi:MAG: hypothetical protein WCT27_00795 [Patescibacteria group bacterium]|jgi:hypothetical protein